MNNNFELLFPSIPKRIEIPQFSATLLGFNGTDWLFIARHGETIGNKKNLIYGKLESPLTLKGIKQAKQVGNALQGLGIVEIHTGPLIRTRRTAKFIRHAISPYNQYSIPIPIFVHDTLYEIDAGEVAGLPKAEARQRYPEFFTRRDKENDYKYYSPYPGGESFQDVEKRITQPVNLIQSRRGRGNILIVGSEGLDRMIRKLVLDKPIGEIMQVKHPNDDIIAINLTTREEIEIHSALA